MAGNDMIPSAPDRSSGLEVAVGRALDWHEAGWGRFVDEVPHAFATRKIDSIAGSNDIDVFGAPTLWQGMRNVALGILSGAAFVPGCAAFELRYVATPQPESSTRIQMLATAKTRSWHAGPAEAAVEAACAALPAGFTWGTPDAEALTHDHSSGYPVLELRRQEEITTPQWDYIPSDFYYTINDDPGDGSGWPRFWAILANAARPVAISLLFEQTDITWDERNTLAGITSDLALFAQARTDYDVLGEPVYYPADTNAAVALDSWNSRTHQLQRPLLARVAIRAPLDIGAPIATALASAIAASSRPDGGTQPMYVELPQTTRDERQAAFSFDWLEILPWGGHPIWAKDSAPHVLRRLPYLFGINEAAGLAVLPVPDGQGVPGFARATPSASRRSAIAGSADTRASITVGRSLHHGAKAGQIRLPLTAINRHTLIVGASGSGKTTTALSLLAELWREHHVPFLAIEPIKTEYRSLLETPGLEDLRVISLGRDDIAPLRLNPLTPPPGVRREVHAGAVMAALKLALPLPPPLPQLLEEALDRTYELAGWDYDTIEIGMTPPTLRGLLDAFESIFEQQGYVGDAKNIGVALNVRLRSLLRGTKGRILDTVESVDFDELMRGPVVIELDEIADADDKAVLSAFVLDRIRASARGRGSTAGELKHVTVIEEAHRLLARANVGDRDTTTGDNLRADSVRAFCEAIAELRALGEGFILSSQSPSALAEAAVANTGVRILHRMESAADREVVLDDLDASQLDREAAARLKAGEALMRWPEQDEAELVNVDAARGVDSGRKVTDRLVANRMSQYAEQTRSLLPYPLCTRDMCIEGCQATVRTNGQSLAAEAGTDAKRLWSDAGGTTRALLPITAMLASVADADAQLAYCTAVHLAVAGSAFNVQRHVDIRPQLMEATRQAVSRDVQ